MRENISKEIRTIEFTQEQFKTLLKLAYLGNWMANANRDGSSQDPHKEEYEKMEDYLFLLAKKFGLEEWVDEEEAVKGKFYPTRFFEEGTDVEELIDDYDEETFWDELIDRFGDRDFYRRYSQNEVKKMTQEERFVKLNECVDRWSDEILEHGIERMGVGGNNNAKTT